MPTWGTWDEGPNDSKVTGIHASLFYDGGAGKVLIFHCRSYPMWSRVYDHETNEMNEANLEVPIWPLTPIEPSRIFCSGHCFMADGRLLVAGGEKDFPYPDYYFPSNEQQVRGQNYCFIFDPQNDPPWSIPVSSSVPHFMNDGRWYPSLTILKNGKILAMGGFSGDLNGVYKSTTNLVPEVYLDGIGWERVSETSNADMPPDLSYFYPAGNLIPKGANQGKVFFSTTQLYPNSNEPPSYTAGDTQLFDPAATRPDPFWQSLGGQRPTPTEHSNHILLPIRLGSSTSKVLVIGGLWYESVAMDRVDLIDLSDTTPDWTTIDPLTYPRFFHNSIILPDRKILVVGGEADGEPVLTSELLDTDTLTWDTVDIPEMVVSRRYHSAALLLPNGKILCTGGRVPDGGDVEDDTERRLSIFTPGYLLDGEQPKVYDPPTELTYDEDFSVTLDGTYPLDSIAFVKPMSVTHGYNSEQRYIELFFEPYGVEGTYKIKSPANSNIAPPGIYMLFVLKDVSESISGLSKIPSKAVFIKLYQS